MKNKTAIKLLTASLLLGFFFSNNINAQTYDPVASEEVVVSANIVTDLYTQLSLNPPTVEIKQPSTVNITAVEWDGTPKPNRSIVIYISGSSSGISITQPALTNSFGQTSGKVSSSIPGTYTVCSKDITEGYDIVILDCETLYVIPLPVPVMIAEPQYTKGDRNIVMWNMTGTGIYQYYSEASTDITFALPHANSGWIPNLAYEFQNLANGQMYFYRVKARNAFGGESAWSNVVFSVQDSSGPEIELISISEIGENNTQEWEKDFAINIRYRIKDNIGISSREFWCIGSDGSRYDCKYTSVLSGDLWTVTLKLKDLQNVAGKLFNEYRFCVEAKDTVDNVTRYCEATLSVPDIEDEVPGEPSPPSEPEIPEIPKPTPKVPVIDRVKKVIEDLFENTVAKLDPIELQNLTYTTTTANIAVGLSFLLSTLGYIPYFFLQLILALSSLLGFRKKGNITGYVYNSLTKEPIPQAIVRIFNESHELVWTDVTDNNGYFRSTDFEDAEYYIKVTARNYIFPSKIVFGKTDFPLENVYHGDSFLTRENKIPNFSIPLDEKEVTYFKVLIAKFISRTKAIWKSFHIILFFAGLMFSIYAVHVSSTFWNYLILILYVPALIALVISLFYRKERYGVVRNQKREEMGGVVVGLTEREFSKLISKRVTDNLGRYRFIVNKGIYDISIMNSDMKVMNPEKISDIEIENEGGSILCPNITINQLEDNSGTEEIVEPLKEL